jgi:hypothetical protein
LRKIAEIDSAAVYAARGLLPFKHFTRYNGKMRWKADPQWIEVALTPAQYNFLKDRTVVFRPHPRHNPTIEVFVDKTTLSERDKFILSLLF